MNHVEYLQSEILMCGGGGGDPEDTIHYRSKTVKSRIFFPHEGRSYKILKIF